MGQLLPLLGNNLLAELLSIFLLFIAIFFLVTYLFIGMRDILAIIRNYNFGRADYCRFGVCGLYHKSQSNEKKEYCFNPFIDQNTFYKLKNKGNSRGCLWSMPKMDNESPVEYLSLYLDHIRAFRMGDVWWRVVSVLFGIGLLVFGVINLTSILF